MAGKILIIDDDRDITQIIRILLEGEGFETCTAYSGAQALASLDETVELIILDIMMDGMNGFEACHRIRESSYVPILFLSAMSGDSEKVAALMAGGDDYLCKPFSAAELTARVRSLLRRYRVYQGADRAEPERERLVLGMDNKVTVNGRAIRLSYTEYEILHLFLKHRGQVLSIQDNFLWCKLLSSSSHATINSPRSDTPPCPQRRIVKIGLLSIHGVICDCFEHLVCQAVSIRSCFNLLNCFNPASIDSKTYSRVKCRLCIVDCIAHFCCWHMYQVSFILM